MNILCRLFGHTPGQNYFGQIRSVVHDGSGSYARILMSCVRCNQLDAVSINLALPLPTGIRCCIFKALEISPEQEQQLNKKPAGPFKKISFKQKKELEARDILGEEDFLRFMGIIEDCNRIKNEFAKQKRKPTDNERIELEIAAETKRLYSTLIYGSEDLNE